MSVKVVIPTPLRVHAGGKAAAEFPAATVAEALTKLTAEFGELKKHLYTNDGKLRSFVNVYVNGEDIRYLLQENTPTRDGDTINIIPSIAGGRSKEAKKQGSKEKADPARWLLATGRLGMTRKEVRR